MINAIGVKQGDLIRVVIFDKDTAVEFQEVFVQEKIINQQDVVKISGVYKGKQENFVTINSKGKLQEFYLGEEVSSLFENEEIKIGDTIEVSVYKDQETGISTILFAK